MNNSWLSYPTLSNLLDEREEIATRLADWRRRWDRTIAAQRGTAELSMAGLMLLDDRALEIANACQASPSLAGGLTQPD